MTTNAISGQAITITVGGASVAGSTSFTLSFAQATIDVTSRDDNFQAAFIPGKRDAKIDIDALYVYSNVGKKVLQQAAAAGGAASTFVMTMPDGCTYTGSGIITAFALTMPAEAAVVYKASIQVTGTLTISVS